MARTRNNILVRAIFIYEFFTKSVKSDQLSTLKPLISLTDFLNQSIFDNCITVLTIAVKSSAFVK